MKKIINFLLPVKFSFSLRKDYWKEGNVILFGIMFTGGDCFYGQQRNIKEIDITLLNAYVKIRFGTPMPHLGINFKEVSL